MTGPSKAELSAMVEEADLPMPESPPKGAEWIAAYGRWA